MQRLKSKLFIFLVEILRLTGKGNDRRAYSSSSRDEESDREHSRSRDRGRDGDSSNKKPRYRSYAGAVVVEEVVKLSEKVVVPVKEYPKVRFFLLECLFFLLN